MKEKLRALGRWIDRWQKPILFFAVFGAIFFRYTVWDGGYFWQLDDYIQYINFPSCPDYGALLMEQGLLVSRPLAALTDLYFWSRFSGCMTVCVFLLSALYAGSAMLWQSTLRRRFGTGRMFLILYTLMPFGIEGTYWVSASTRLICGMFWGSLSLWFLCRFAEEKRPLFAVLYFPTLLLAYGYYEQSLVLAAAASLLLMLDFLFQGNRRGLLALWTFGAAGVYFLVTSLFAGAGAISGRMVLALPDNPWYFRVFLPEVCGQVLEAFFGAGAAITFGGFGRGIQMLFSQGKWLWLLGCLAFAVLLSWLIAKEKTVALPPAQAEGEEGKAPGRRILWAYVFGLLLTLAPISIFFFIANPFFSMRNTVPSFVGLAFLIDLTLRLLLRRQVKLRALLCGLTVCLFCVASVSEMYDYRATYRNDRAVVEAVVAKMQAEEEPLKGKRVALIGCNATFLQEQNYYFNGHIVGVTAGEWSLYGAMAACYGGTVPCDVIPMSTNESFLYSPWETPTKKLDGFDVFWHWDHLNRCVRELSAEPDGAGGYRLVFADDGSFFARIWEEPWTDGTCYGYIRFTET
ncbi:MAG: hypothetical protein IJZ02_03905 [Clostridia bacterium]|nr:hypothetical protein [Clostridia bacterium]